VRGIGQILNAEDAKERGGTRRQKKARFARIDLPLRPPRYLRVEKLSFRPEDGTRDSITAP